MKLKIRFTLIIVMMMTVMLTGISVVLLMRARAIQITAAQNNMKGSTGIYAEDLGGRYEEYLEIVEVFAGIMRDFENLEARHRRSWYNEAMSATLKAYSGLMGIYTVWMPNALDGRDAEMANTPGTDETGMYISWYVRHEDRVELQAYTNYREVLANLVPHSTISDPVPVVLDGQDSFSVTFTAPIMSKHDDHVLGVISIDINLTYSQSLIEQIVPYGAGTAALYSNSGIIAAHHDSSLRGLRFQEASLDALGNEGVASIERSLETGEPMLVLHDDLIVQSYPFYIGDTPGAWAVISAVPKQVVMADVAGMTRFTVITVFVAVILSAVIIFCITGNITKPIITVSRTLRDISEGEGDLTKQIQLDSKDELGDLAHYFNLTLEKIKNLVIIIKKQSSALFDIGNELASSMTETAAAVNQITANIQSIKGRMVNQSASVTETNSTMEQITVNINKLNKSIEEQTSSVSQSSSAVEQMLASIDSVTQTLVRNAGSVNDLANASEIGRTGLQEVAADIQDIARESEGLLGINAVMENIASQTNLLSMNAAIEAAHAGETGKGFAVVADEIRKLAENSGEQSKTISVILKKIKASIDKITNSTNAVLTKFEAIDSGVKTVSAQEENIRDSMEEQNTGSQQILEAIGRLNEISRAVKGGSAEMLEGSREVIQESKNLEAVTQEISSGMNEMAIGADEINIAVNKVNTISGENKKNIDILVQEVSRFKVE